MYKSYFFSLIGEHTSLEHFIWFLYVVVITCQHVMVLIQLIRDLRDVKAVFRSIGLS